MKTSSGIVLGESDWQIRRFSELTLTELQDIYLARQQVFVVEQACAYLDVDGCDEASIHVIARAPGQRVPVAYARLVEPGVKYPEPAMGRVLTMPAVRGIGLGRELVARVLRLSDALFPGLGLRISAQSRLEAFYLGFGFQPIGSEYLEDGIPHREMLRG